MAKRKSTNGQDRLKKIEDRLAHLESIIDKPARIESRETVVAPWRFLVRRQHPWRKQLYVKGRNLTARQLIGSLKANHLNEEDAAANHRLPIEVIREALAYVEKNSELLEAEAEIERLMHKRQGGARVPQPVS